jgi:hypothetical protein
MALPNTRRELAQHLEQVMSHAYAQLEERQRLEADTSLVKTYLVEAHRLRAADHDRTLQLIRATFVADVLGRRADTRVHETEDDRFFNIEFGRRDEQDVLYVDASNPRFWLVHSTAKSNDVDPIIEKLVNNTNEFDHVWIPIQLLMRIAQFGSLRGLGLDYDRREVPDVDFEAPNAPVEFLKIQLWGNRAGDVLRILKQEGAFPDATTLSKVKVKYFLDNVPENFCIADIKYDGKVTGRGMSYQSYITLVTNLYRDYQRRIEDYERRFTVTFRSAEDRLSVEGEPLNVRFIQPLPNLEAFCESVFSGSIPFRLMGLPIQTGRQNFRVNAIDLHVGRRMSFELSPEFMRVYLAPGGCGNSLARLYTNLQHYYNSQVEAVDGSEQFAFQP